MVEFFDFSTNLTSVPVCKGKTPAATRVDTHVNYRGTRMYDRFTKTFASRHTGYLLINTAGSYTLYLSSDDGSNLYLDEALLINNDRIHAMQEREKTVVLRAGYHPLRIEFFEKSGGGHDLVLSWSGPGIEKTVVPASAFWYTPENAPSQKP